MPQTEKSTLALRLRLLRIANGMKQEEVATALGIGRSAYTYYETSRSHPDYDALIRLAQIFRVSIDYLVGISNFPEIAARTRVADDIAETDMAPENGFGMLSSAERQLVCLYRQLSEDEQMKYLEALQKKSGKRP